MLDTSHQIMMFIHVVEAGTISAAARDLKLTPSAVSKQVSRLENYFGIRLLNRSTHGISLTENGSVLYRHAKKIATEFEDLEEIAKSLAGNATGKLRVVSTVAFGKSQLMPIVPSFLESYPEIELNLELSDRPVDMSSGDVDVAILFSEQITDDSVVMRKLATIRQLLCASKEYVQKFGLPETQEQLLSHNCLQVSTVRGWNDWQLIEEDENISKKMKSNFQVNSTDALYHAVLAGVGVAQLSDYLIAEELKKGTLIEILPNLISHSSDIAAIFPERRNLSIKVRIFIDYLIQQFQPIPPWENKLAGGLQESRAA